MNEISGMVLREISKKFRLHDERATVHARRMLSLEGRIEALEDLLNVRLVITEIPGPVPHFMYTYKPRQAADQRKLPVVGKDTIKKRFRKKLKN